MRVVCAACQQHYADLDSALPFEELLVYSDVLAEWHAPWCQATRAEHQAALQILQAVQSVEAAS